MIKTITTFSAKIQANKNEILSNLNPKIKAEIESIDPHPFYQAFCTIHEGKERPHIIGNSNPPEITFPREAVKTVKKCVRATLQAFNNHIPGTNSTYKRPALGKIAGHYEKELSGRLAHIAIFYHPPEVREEAKQFDSCSHEGDWNFSDDGREIRALEMLDFTGVALLNRDETPPAFRGALKMGSLQAHEYPGNGEPGYIVPPGNGIQENTMDLSTLSYQEFMNQVKSELNRRQVWPSDIFSLEMVKKDRNYSKEFEEKEALSGKVSEMEKMIESLSGEKTSLEQEKNKLTAAPRLSEKIKSHPDKLRAFIDREYKKSALNDYSNNAIDEFVNRAVEQYNQEVEFWGVSKKDDPLPTGGGDKPPEEIDYSDPTQNPILKEIFNTKGT